MSFGMTVLGVAGAAFAATLLWPTADGADSAPTEPPHYDFICDVRSITDGDTLRCMDGTRVRLHAISARETDNTCSPGHPCPSALAGESTYALAQLAGSRITCQRTGTSYNRVNAICHNSAWVEINCAMVESGAAAIWPKFNRQRPICRS